MAPSDLYWWKQIFSHIPISLSLSFSLWWEVVEEARLLNIGLDFFTRTHFDVLYRYPLYWSFFYFFFPSFFSIFFFFSFLLPSLEMQSEKYVICFFSHARETEIYISILTASFNRLELRLLRFYSNTTCVLIQKKGVENETHEMLVNIAKNWTGDKRGSLRR